MAPPYLPELKRGRRAFEYKAEVLSKQCHTGENMPVTVSNRGGALLLNGWQEAAMDLSKAGDLGIGGEVAATVDHMSHQVHPSSHKLPAMGAMQSVIQSAMQGSVGVDMAGIEAVWVWVRTRGEVDSDVRTVAAITSLSARPEGFLEHTPEARSHTMYRQPTCSSCIESGRILYQISRPITVMLQYKHSSIVK